MLGDSETISVQSYLMLRKIYQLIRQRCFHFVAKTNFFFISEKILIEDAYIVGLNSSTELHYMDQI